MSKLVYDKWNELKDSVQTIGSNNIVIAAYYLSPKAKTQLYFGRNREDQYIYIEFLEQYLRDVDLPEFKGIEITHSKEPNINPDRSYIKIKNNTDNEELFIALSSSLYEGLIETNDYKSALFTIRKILDEYRDFFKNPNHQLTLQEEQGLCSELLELRQLIQWKGVGSVFHWQGPLRNKRDFVFSNSSMEVKSTLTQIEPSIHISNENQLDCSFPESLINLFLKVYIFEKDDNGFDVISCANEIIKLLDNDKAYSFFISNLLKLKIDINEYKPRCRFTLQTCKQFRITKSFPCIIPDCLPKGVFNVEYRLRLDALGDYEIEEKELYDGL